MYKKIFSNIFRSQLYINQMLFVFILQCVQLCGVVRQYKILLSFFVSLGFTHKAIINECSRKFEFYFTFFFITTPALGIQAVLRLTFRHTRNGHRIARLGTTIYGSHRLQRSRKHQQLCINLSFNLLDNMCILKS